MSALRETAEKETASLCYELLLKRDAPSAGIAVKEREFLRHDEEFNGSSTEQKAERENRTVGALEVENEDVDEAHDYFSADGTIFRVLTDYTVYNNSTRKMASLMEKDDLRASANGLTIFGSASKSPTRDEHETNPFLVVRPSSPYTSS